MSRPLASEDHLSLPISKDADFYLPEGNIILAVGCGREDATLFRLCMSQLARHSTVFDDMLVVTETAAAPSGGQTSAERYDDCPVLRLDDQVDDMRQTFRVLWELPSDQPSTAMLLAILRISTKYVMSHVRDWALRHLYTLFPPDRSELYSTTHFARWREGQTSVNLILAGVKCDVPSLLSYAYYALATSNWANPSHLDDIGLDRLDASQLVKLSVARAHLQSQLAGMFLHNGVKSEPIGYHHDLESCTKVIEGGRPCTGRSMNWSTPASALARYIVAADLIRWIKESKENMMRGSNGWEFCSICRKDWISQAEAKMNQVFDGFCSAAGLPVGGEQQQAVTTN